MGTRQISVRVSDSVFEDLQRIADIAKIDVSKLLRYFTNEKVQEYRINLYDAYEPGFWQDATTWVKFKDAVMQLKVQK